MPIASTWLATSGSTYASVTDCPSSAPRAVGQRAGAVVGERQLLFGDREQPRARRRRQLVQHAERVALRLARPQPRRARVLRHDHAEVGDQQDLRRPIGGRQDALRIGKRAVRMCERGDGDGDRGGEGAHRGRALTRAVTHASTSGARAEPMTNSRARDQRASTPVGRRRRTRSLRSTAPAARRLPAGADDGRRAARRRCRCRRCPS